MAKPLECAVHYAKADGSFYYRVLPKGTSLELPDTSEQSIAEWVAGESGWAEAPTGPVELPEGEEGTASRLQVHVGQWPDASEYEEDMQAFAQHVLRMRNRGGRHREIQVEKRRQLREVARSAPPPSRIDGPSGVRDILGSGQFRVTGNVYFAPLQPFQPAPNIPSSQEEAEKRLLAQQEIPEYRYG